MNIVISNYDDVDNPYYGGGGAIAVNQVARYLAQKHQVTVITGAYPESKNAVKDNVVYKRIGLSRGGPYIGQLIFHLLLPWYCQREAFDVWIESFTPPFSTSFLPWFTDKPVVGLTHFFSAEDLSQKYYLPFAWIQNLGIKYYRYVITVSPHLSQRLSQLNPKLDIQYIANASTIKPSTHINTDPQPYLLYIGRINFDQKGLDLLLKAYARIKTSSLKLKIAGKATKKQLRQLNQMLRELDIHHRVTYVGFINGHRKRNLYHQAWAVVIPSRHDEQSLVALEAISQATPIVSFQIDGLSWLTEEYVLKAKSFDIDAFSQLLSRISLPHVRREYAQRIYSFPALSNWKQVSSKYENYLKQIVDQ